MVKENILITGATGFLGSHLALSFASANLYIARRMHSESGDWRIASLTNVKTIDLDQLRKGTLRTTLNGESIPVFDCVYHLATSGNQYGMYETNNLVDGTISLTMDIVSFCHWNKSKKLIIAGSSAEYGDHGKIKLSESIKLKPDSIYGASKVSAVLMGLTFAKFLEVNVNVARFFTVYGPADKPYNVIPSMIQAIYTDVPFDLTQGEQIRDFIYIDDVIEALHQMKISNLQPGQIINIGTGKGNSLREVGKYLLDFSKANPSVFRWGVRPYRDNESMEMICDVKKSSTLLKWKAQTSIEDGLRQTYYWYEKLFGGILCSKV
ncbi:MAG: NAD(P)-dependent oxidoreductase [Caldisericia bacterium]|nr:NAD(P)-dependent oxidoreductase [Caldisericia bacterium]